MPAGILRRRHDCRRRGRRQEVLDTGIGEGLDGDHLDVGDFELRRIEAVGEEKGWRVRMRVGVGLQWKI